MLIHLIVMMLRLIYRCHRMAGSDIKVIIDGQLDTINIKAGTDQINTEPVQIKQLCCIRGFASRFLPMFLQSRRHPQI